MTPQEKLIAISGYLPYGLKVQHTDIETEETTVTDVVMIAIDCIGFDNACDYYLSPDDMDEYNPIVKSILFPIESLYKEIRVKSYNNGEPFIPIVELAKVIWGQYEWVLSEDGRFAVSNTGGVYKDFKYQPINEVFNINGNPTIYHLQIYDLLNSWLIDYRGLIEQGESISVLDINPELYG